MARCPGQPRAREIADRGPCSSIRESARGRADANFVDKFTTRTLFSATMSHMKLQLLSFLHDRRGGSAPEYALILAAVAGAVAVGLALFGSSLGNGLRASAQYVDRVALNFGPAGGGAAAVADQTAAAAAVPGAAASPADRSSASHGRSGPARGRGSAGQSADAPGQGGSSPGDSESAPGKTK